MSVGYRRRGQARRAEAGHLHGRGLQQTLLNAKSITYLKEGASTIHLRKLFVQLGIADVVKSKAVETLRRGGLRVLAEARWRSA